MPDAKPEQFAGTSIRREGGLGIVKHYVLLKLAPGTDVEAARDRVWQTYRALDEELVWLNRPEVYRTCVERDSNADIMAVIELDSPEYLQPYLTHPLHLQMARDMKDVVVGRTSFDHN